MPRQVKIGFDKVPAPLTKSFHQLVDIKGVPLTDAAGNPLVTQESARNLAFTVSSNSMPAVVGNKGKKEALPVEEVFAGASEVSSTLLGVDRAEEQLSLFADVSTYGLARDNWNYYTVGHGRVPYEWYNRKHPIFGNRGPAEFHEETSEQALYLKSFPTQYRWPTHPDGVSEIPVPTSQFGKYLRFIALGRWLYEIWIDVNPKFANDNFIGRSLEFVDSNFEVLPITKTSWQPITADTGGWANEGDMRNIIYAQNGFLFQESMNQVERWTLFYFLMRNDDDVYPPYPVYDVARQRTINYNFKNTSLGGALIPNVGEYLAIQSYTRGDFTRPGGDENNTTTGVLESKQTYRYQPGRVSGFTFGLRMKNNPREQSDKIEWGCSNDTDQYMLQVTGSQWNIVRRSTQRIPDSVLEDPAGMNLQPADDFRKPQVEMVENSAGELAEPQLPPGRDKSSEMFEVRVPRSKWNGDPLNGTGPSGHIANLETVTMYKIEFSWYGAIGAKFYAYVPAGSGEARWVLLHTWVIENKLKTPALQAADFKFRYVVFNKNTSNLVEPSFVYKYGSSYYIDGGDEGNITLSSVTGQTRSFTRSPGEPVPVGSVVALHPKTKILNSFGYDPSFAAYDGILNNKKIYPMTLAAISDKNVRIDILKVKVSPDGQHGTKTVSLASKQRFEKDVAFTFTNRAALEFKNPTDTTLPYTQAFPLTKLDNFGRLIGQGLPNTFLRLREGSADFADLVRRNGNNCELQQVDFGERAFLGGSRSSDVVQINEGLDTNLFSAKLSSYRSVVASDTPIYANRFKIHFLNPYHIDPRVSMHRLFADFAIGVTGDIPSISTEDDGEASVGVLTFGENKRVYPYDPPIIESEDEGEGELGGEGEGEGEEEVTSVFDSGEYFDVNSELHVEWSSTGHLTSVSTLADLRETDSGEGTRFEQDYRIEGIERPFSNKYGSAACIQGTVQTISYPIEGVDQPETPSSEVDEIVWDQRIIFGSTFPPVSGNTIGRAEVGIDGAGTGYVFVTKPSIEVVGGQRTFTAYIAKRDANVPTYNFSSSTSIDAKIVTLEDDNKISNADKQRDFTISEVFQFDVQPLYLFVAMKSNARINNIVIEEISSTTSTTHVPNFLGAIGQVDATGLDSEGNFKKSIESSQINSVFEGDERSSSEFNVEGKETSNIVIIKDVQTTADQAPSNFLSDDRLSGIRFDTQTDLPLAPGDNIYSFYIGEDEAVEFGLQNIFNIDRATMTPGLFNNEAYYFKATPVAASDTASVQMTLTCKEQ